MKNIVIGRYVPGNSFLYKMDPRTKIIALLLMMAGTFIIDSLYVMVGTIFLMVFILLIGKISVKRVYLGLRPLLFLLIFTFVFQILFNTQGDLLYEAPLYYSPLNIIFLVAIFLMWMFTKRFIRFKLLYFIAMLLIAGTILSTFEWPYTFFTGNFSVYEDALQMALFIMLRLIIIVTLSTILTITTKPTDLNLGLESVLKPLKVIKINSEEIAMIISIALRYIPTLLDEANKIMLAQASRGVDFQEGKLKDKVMQIVSLLVPMFIISFKRSEELADAMEARSFIPGNPRTKLHELSWQRIDTAGIIFANLFILSSIVIRVMV